MSTQDGDCKDWEKEREKKRSGRKGRVRLFFFFLLCLFSLLVCLGRVSHTLHAAAILSAVCALATDARGGRARVEDAHVVPKNRVLPPSFCCSGFSSCALFVACAPIEGATRERQGNDKRGAAAGSAVSPALAWLAVHSFHHPFRSAHRSHSASPSPLFLPFADGQPNAGMRRGCWNGIHQDGLCWQLRAVVHLPLGCDQAQSRPRRFSLARALLGRPFARAAFASPSRRFSYGRP